MNDLKGVLDHAHGEGLRAIVVAAHHPVGEVPGDGHRALRKHLVE